MSKHIRVRWWSVNQRRKNANARRAAAHMAPVATLTQARKELREVQRRERGA